MQHLLELLIVMAFFIIRIGIPLLIIAAVGTLVEQATQQKMSKR